MGDRALGVGASLEHMMELPIPALDPIDGVITADVVTIITADDDTYGLTANRLEGDNFIILSEDVLTPAEDDYNSGFKILPDTLSPREIEDLLVSGLVHDRIDTQASGLGISTTTPGAIAPELSPEGNQFNIAANNARGTVTLNFRSTLHTSGAVPSPQLVSTPGEDFLRDQGSLARTGHIFRGWRHPDGTVIPPGTRLIFTTPVTGTINFDAHWEPAIVTVRFFCNNLTSGQVPGPQPVNTPGHIILPNQGTMRRTGYAFVGWRASTGDIFAAGTRINFAANMFGMFDLHAAWEPAVVTITYRSTGHTGTLPRPQTVNTPGSVRLASQGDLRRTGHILLGWRDGAGTIFPLGGTVNFPSPISGEATLDAHWVRSEVTIIYESIGHTSGSVPARHTVPTPGQVTLRGPGTLRRTGHAFVGWRALDGSILRPEQRVSFPNAVAATLPLQAHWVPIVTMRYDVMVSDTPLLAQAYGFVDDVSPAFMNTFGIDLVRNSGSVRTDLRQRPGCERLHAPNDFCNYSCGNSLTGADCRTHHHRSGNHFIHVGQRSGINTFRFVDYWICSYRGGGRHIRVNGLAFRWGHDKITTTRSDNVRRTTAHEISHLFGVNDTDVTPCTGPECVMMSGSPAQDQWCNAHWAELLAGRNR